MNNYQSEEVVIGSTWADEVIAAWKTTASGPLIATAKLRLSHDPAFNPTPASKISDLTPQECTFSGYPSGGAAFTISDPLNASLVVRGAIGSNVFVATTATPFVSDTAYGYWVDNGTNVIVAEKFAAAQSAPFAVPGDFLDLTVLLPINLLQATA